MAPLAFSQNESSKISARRGGRPEFLSKLDEGRHGGSRMRRGLQRWGSHRRTIRDHHGDMAVQWME